MKRGDAIKAIYAAMVAKDPNQACGSLTASPTPNTNAIPQPAAFAEGKQSEETRKASCGDGSLLNGFVTGDPTATSFKDQKGNDIFVFGVGRDSALYVRTLTSASGGKLADQDNLALHPWVSLGGEVKASPLSTFVGMIDGKQTLIVFAIGAHDTGQANPYVRLTTNGEDWTPWQHFQDTKIAADVYGRSTKSATVSVTNGTYSFSKAKDSAKADKDNNLCMSVIPINSAIVQVPGQSPANGNPGTTQPNTPVAPGNPVENPGVVVPTTTTHGSLEACATAVKTVTFRFSNKNFLIADYQFYNSFDDELDRKQAIRVINVVKAFHDKVDNDKVFKNLLTTKFHDINMMKKQFIDINKIKNKKEEIKKELFLKELDEALKINKTFKITRKDGQTLNSWNFFPLANGWFNSITFESNSLKYSNSITLHDKSFIAYASKSVKKEKLIEIFEKMDFKIIPLVEEIVEAKEEAKNKK
jgi:hypothetical protein